jgi:REP element-mobilizing transposase RayT
MAYGGNNLDRLFEPSLAWRSDLAWQGPRGMLGGVSRPLRLEHPGAVWHVTSRGNERRQVFRDDVDREEWLALLGKVVLLFAWRLHGYVMMGNHYHLIVETPTPSLSRGMRHLNGVFTQAFNRRHQRVGHLFQGRFKSILVEKESHLLELLRYVVLNPVRAGLVRSPGEWAWSSYRATAGDAPAPAWLETAWSLAQFGGAPEAAEQRYREFVGFVNDALGRAARRTRDPEIPRPQRMTAPLSVEQLMPAVLDLLATTDRELVGHPRKRVRERAILAYMLRRFAGATGTTIARVLGVSAWRASALARAGEGHWHRDGRLAAGVNRALGRNV